MTEESNGRIAWTTETRRLGDLLPWEPNPRQSTRAQAKRIEESIREFGYSQLVEIEPDNTIIDGHQRNPILRLLKDFGPDAEIECRVASRPLSLDERKKYIAFKHRGAVGEWDVDAVLNLFDGPDLVEWGFDADEVLDFGFELDEPPPDDPGAQVDRAEELREKWGVESGQLWQLGEHRLICGDCTDAAVVERVMDIHCHLMVTDPPYGVEYDASWRDKAAKDGLLQFGASRLGAVHNDEQVDWELAVNSFSGDVIYLWHAGLHARESAEFLERSGFIIRCQIIWNKPHFVIGRGHYHTRHEPCWYAFRKGKTAKWIGDNNQDTIWNVTLDKNTEGGHSTQKPVELMERSIRNHEGDVYDPFLGSGTTLIACERLSRKCRAVEISLAYCAVTLERWHDMTGDMPELLTD